MPSKANIKMKAGLVKTVLIKTFCLLIYSFVAAGSQAETIKGRLDGRTSLLYGVSFNGIDSGEIKWQYLGEEKIRGKEVNVLQVSSDTKIAGILDLESDEKIFLDSRTSLPVKVEREVKMFGKKETISEIYRQKKGVVELVNKAKEVRKRTISQDKPIHNILDLLYFFPDSIKLVPGEWMHFNLPTYKIRIKFIRDRRLKLNGEVRDTYFLVGRGGKRFSLWLDKDDKFPLRLEFVSLLGKITIFRKQQ